MPDDPFTGTAAHYARSRPGYGDAALEHVLDRFDLDEESRVLDLGCGAGQLAVPIARHAGSVVAMDPNEAMCAATEQRAAAAVARVEDAGERVEAHVETVVGSDADLRAEHIEAVAPLDLTTMGRSFHWMEQRATLECLREHTVPGGGVAIVDDEEWLTAGSEPWMAAVHEVADRYLADLPGRSDPATVEYDDPWDELLVEQGFADVETATFAVERPWTVDEIVDYVFSLSFASPNRFGATLDAFERDCRERLAALGEAPFEQTAAVSVLSGRV